MNPTWGYEVFEDVIAIVNRGVGVSATGVVMVSPGLILSQR